MSDCNCSERFIVREDDKGHEVIERLTKPEFFRCHDCAYVQSRNSNIPSASQLAEERAGDPTDDPDYGYRGNEHVTFPVLRAARTAAILRP